jgi:oxygen-independent coproporphyrinogen III oxidase
VAGIYIHIPFCRQKCYYCDFYKTVNSSHTGKFLSALKLEISKRKDYIKGENIRTLYFGGGTPSVLTEEELTGILDVLNDHFYIEESAEVTFEANPDDLTPVYLQTLKKAGINRLSIGIQSFFDIHLRKMNRRHDSQQAVHAIEDAFEAGFENISTDLIYGLPGLTLQQWEESLRKMFSLPVAHLSAYHLTYHEGTAFYTWLKKGTLKELSENESVRQFNLLLDEVSRAGFEQYEISNFARNGMYSRHNMAYWTGEKYLGLGPSAHSFNGTSRQWNIAHIDAYMKLLETDEPFFEEEQLSEQEAFNEYILTHIRTKWGISLEEIQKRFGRKHVEWVVLEAEKHIASGKMTKHNEVLKLTREGLFVSDDLMAGFMMV